MPTTPHDVPLHVEVLANPLRSDREPIPPLDAGVRAFHRRLGLAQPSPLHELPDLAPVAGVGRLFVKDESDRLGLPAFKILGASWAAYRALVDRLGHEPEWADLTELSSALEPLRPMALTTATDGNHGRAVASFARRVGLDARIFVPAGTSPRRIEAIRGEGAACTEIDGDYDDAVARAAAEADDRCIVVSDTSWEGYTEIPSRVIEGYATIFAEMDEQLSAAGVDRPDAVLVPIGVGALAAAAARHYRPGRSDGPPTLVGVEPDTADCVMASIRAGHPVEVPGPHPSIMAGLNCGTPSPLAWPLMRDGFEWFCAVGDEVAIAGMRGLAEAGVVSGETGGATLGTVLALGAATTDLRFDPRAVVVAISTEGATDPVRYAELVGRPAAAVGAHRAHG